MTTEPRKIINSKTVGERVPMSRVQRWRRIKAGTFPAPIEVGPNILGWFEDEIEEWLNSRPRRTYAAEAAEREAERDLVDDLRFHRLVEKLYALGPRPYGELLMEIGEQRACRTFIEQRLKAYAGLDPEVVRELDGDEFPRPPLYEVKK